ncbi:MAG: SurA N-terminal domain-containing protein [Gammaproteobacteria bacterium]
MKRYLVLIFGLLTIMNAAANEKLDSIVAVVNGHVVTEKQLLMQKKMYQEQLMHEHAAIPNEQTLKKQALDNLIDIQLSLSEAEKQKITVPEENLQNALKELAKRNNLSLAQMREEVAKQGINWEQYKKQIRNQILISTIQHQAFSSDIKVTPAEIKQYIAKNKDKLSFITEYNVQGILVPLSEEPSADQIIKTSTQANNIIQSLKMGKEIDINNTTTADGQHLSAGDLGWRPLEQLPPDLGVLLLKSQPGNYLGPLEAPNGFYIFKFVDIRKIKNPAIEQDKNFLTNEAKSMLYHEKYTKAAKTWLAELRKHAYIKQY